MTPNEEFMYWKSKSGEELLSLGYTTYAGDYYTYRNNALHSYEDRPARIGPTRLEWKLNGIDHREGNKPDYISSMMVTYMISGVYHRTDGPAYIASDFESFWLINGDSCNTAKEFQELTGHSDEKMAELIMKYGPIK